MVLTLDLSLVEWLSLYSNLSLYVVEYVDSKLLSRFVLLPNSEHGVQYIDAYLLVPSVQPEIPRIL